MLECFPKQTSGKGNNSVERSAVGWIVGNSKEMWEQSHKRKLKIAIGRQQAAMVYNHYMMIC